MAPQTSVLTNSWAHRLAVSRIGGFDSCESIGNDFVRGWVFDEVSLVMRRVTLMAERWVTRSSADRINDFDIGV